MKKNTGKKRKIIKSLIVATGTGALLSSTALAGAISDSPMKRSQSRNAKITGQKDAPMLFAAVKKKVAKKKTTKKKAAKKKK
jgi:hypothetical protein